MKRRIAESRKSLGADFDLQAPPQAQHLSGRQLDDLVSNCLKLASENKISVKVSRRRCAGPSARVAWPRRDASLPPPAQNTWSLNLIDHMADLVKADRDTETNFQKASVTLDAGVKIYSYRVDSVHNETFKMLTGLTRRGRADEEWCGRAHMAPAAHVDGAGVAVPMGAPSTPAPVGLAGPLSQGSCRRRTTPTRTMRRARRDRMERGARRKRALARYCCSQVDLFGAQALAGAMLRHVLALPGGGHGSHVHAGVRGGHQDAQG